VLEADGERVIPELQREQLVYAEHVARYRFAAQLAKGKRVLDAACGEGYGAAMLRDAGAASVVGIDNVRSVVEHARDHYGLEAVEGDVRELPFDAGSFDLVVSFETIEHVPDPQNAVSEFRRVLAQDGRLVISTPNRDEYLVENEFHELELTPDEFLALLSAEFPEQLRLYQQNWLVSAVVDESTLRSDDPDSPLRVTLGKAVGGEPGQELFSVVVCGPPFAEMDAVAVATGIYEAQRMAVDAVTAQKHATEADARALQAEAQRAEFEREQAAWRERALEAERQREVWQERALEAERQRAEVELEQAAWQTRALEAEGQVTAWSSRLVDVEGELDQWRIRALESERELAATRETVHVMETSRSWRVTRPLRAARRLGGIGRTKPT
jgi:SAM-dependent methyltransferase